MKKLVFLSLIASFFLTFPVVSAMGVSAGEHEYQGYTPSLSCELPSETSLAEIQRMSEIEGYNDRELRDKPGGGPGLGELQVPLNFEASNMLVLMFLCAVIIALKNYKNEKFRRMDKNLFTKRKIKTTDTNLIIGL